MIADLFKRNASRLENNPAVVDQKPSIVGDTINSNKSQAPTP